MAGKGLTIGLTMALFMFRKFYFSSRSSMLVGIEEIQIELGKESCC
jgi:hypothetical protein